MRRAPVAALLLGLWTATASPGIAGDLDLPGNELAGLSDARLREAYQAATARLIPEVVLSTEGRRIGIPPMTGGAEAIDVPAGHSVLSDCPMPRKTLDVLSSMVFARNLHDPSHPMTAQVNVVLSVRACPLHEVVEVGVAFERMPDGGARVLVTDYRLGVARD